MHVILSEYRIPLLDETVTLGPKGRKSFVLILMPMYVLFQFAFFRSPPFRYHLLVTTFELE